MAVWLVTAEPKGGKTLRVVSMIRDQLKRGRKVYANIKGLTLEHEPTPDDWRTCEPGSFIVYDEAQKIFPASGGTGLSEDGRIRDLDTHAHSGYDIVFITQHHTLVHSHLRKFVNVHEYIRRTGGLETVVVHRWDRAGNPNDHFDLEQADKEVWRYPRDLYQCYVSATMHIKRKRIPKKILLAGSAAVGVFLVVGYLVATRGFLGHGVVLSDEASVSPVARSAAVAAVAPSSSGLMNWTAAAEVKPVAGCISSARACMCWTEQGVPLDLDEVDCRNAMEAPMPRAISAPERSGGRKPATSS